MLLLGLGIVLLLVGRVPVGFAFLGPCLAYMLLSGQSFGLSLRLVVEGAASFPLLAVPLFILVGTIANHAGIADRLFDFALAALGRVRGSLGYVSVAVSMVFSWMSGSAVADAAGLGKIEIPAMQRNGYPFRFSAGVTGASALIAPVMPPSIPAIIYAGIATVSTGALFAASVIPAFLMAFGLCIVVFFWVRSIRGLEPTRFEWHRLRRAALRAAGALGAPVVILGGILGGFFTPTEAAAVGAVYTLMLGFSYRTLQLNSLPRIVRDSASTTATIMIIIASASLLGWILARERVPQGIAEAMLSFTDSKTVFLLLTAVLMLALGTTIDPTAVLVITVPILLPVAGQFGVDSIVLGVVMIVSLMIGLLTPPVGTVLYVLSSVTEARVNEVVRGVVPFLVPLVAVVVLIIAIPSVVTYLPQQLGL